MDLIPEAMKKPAAAKKPLVALEANQPSDNHKGSAIPYKCGKILVSQSKKSYRVFLKATDKVDATVPWGNYSTRAKAWAAALDRIAKGK